MPTHQPAQLNTATMRELLDSPRIRRSASLNHHHRDRPSMQAHTIVQANLTNPQHAQAMLHLLNAYALDPMGGGEPLSCFVQANLVAELQKRTNVLAILAVVGDEPAGLAICVEGFSTFACKSLLNVHDMVVLPQFRGRKLSQHILAKAQELAVQRGCCKLTLEVLQGNTLAQQAYRAFGFEPYQLDAQMGQAQFWQKAL